MKHIATSVATITNKMRWLAAVGLSALFIVPTLLYIRFGYDVSLLESISFTAASTASLLFATALSMGSINHFTGWPSMSYGFQKQIGILAFWWSLLYSLSLSILYPELYWYGLPEHFFSVDVLLGLCALCIFATMVFVNSAWISPHVNKPTIYFVLGLGYVGYALLIIRAIFLEFPLWVEWFTVLSELPPGRLVLSCIAFLVLLLRLAVAIDKHRKLPT